jgi:release factor glutamine methyltransferase
LLERRFREGGIATARVEAEWLLADSLGLSRTALYLREEPIDPTIQDAVLALCQRRLRGEPLQYVIGAADFYGLRFSVCPAAFIPRPETEVLAEQAIRYLQGMAGQEGVTPRALDVGTGSGNVAVSLALAVPTCAVTALELSWGALALAKANVDRHGLSERVRLIQSDWTSGVKGFFHLIVSNPPYVLSDDVGRLQANGLAEPRMSLDGGVDGMAFHRRLIAEAPRLLARGGALAFECAEDQAGELERLATTQPWVRRVRIFEDLAGRPRGLWIESHGQAHH